jgi:hypothetical protein
MSDEPDDDYKDTPPDRTETTEFVVALARDKDMARVFGPFRTYRAAERWLTTGGHDSGKVVWVTHPYYPGRIAADGFPEPAEVDDE